MQVCSLPATAPSETELGETFPDYVSGMPLFLESGSCLTRTWAAVSVLSTIFGLQQALVFLRVLALSQEGWAWNGWDRSFLGINHQRVCTGQGSQWNSGCLCSGWRPLQLFLRNAATGVFLWSLPTSTHGLTLRVLSFWSSGHSHHNVFVTCGPSALAISQFLLSFLFSFQCVYIWTNWGFF